MNLILGIINKYKFNQIENFILSVQAVQSKAHICLYAGPLIHQKTIKKIQSTGIEVIRYVEDFPYIISPHENNFKSLPEPIHLYNFRHFLYYDYLLKSNQNFENVLITDVKDVFFQKDPFDFKIENRIYVAVENTSILIKDCACTSKWIRKGYGDSMVDQMKDKEVVCAGTTIAPFDLMKKYLYRLIKEFFIVKDAYKCADQAMHNVLIHYNLIQPIIKCYNFNGPILTVGTEPTYKLNEDKDLININGDIIPIIHQYDRHEELIKLINSKHKMNNGFRRYFKIVKNLISNSSTR